MKKIDYENLFTYMSLIFAFCIFIVILYGCAFQEKPQIYENFLVDSDTGDVKPQLVLLLNDLKGSGTADETKKIETAITNINTGKISIGELKTTAELIKKISATKAAAAAAAAKAAKDAKDAADKAKATKDAADKAKATKDATDKAAKDAADKAAKDAADKANAATPQTATPQTFALARDAAKSAVDAFSSARDAAKKAEDPLSIATINETAKKKAFDKATNERQSASAKNTRAAIEALNKAQIELTEATNNVKVKSEASKAANATLEAAKDKAVKAATTAAALAKDAAMKAGDALTSARSNATGKKKTLDNATNLRKTANAKELDAAKNAEEKATVESNTADDDVKVKLSAKKEADAVSIAARDQVVILQQPPPKKK